ncbi:unnamed protein product [Caenorhabditis sp. 36 PRJEB53466]|nr:unnamed protein product [Caenorhabditis sp. 36 PRJEB53466]
MDSASSDHWLLSNMVDAAPNTIGVVIIIFNAIGHFGNFNLIYATFKNHKLQSKHGWLLVILCSEHSICLCFEFINVYFALTGIHIPRIKYQKWRTSRYLVLLTVTPVILPVAFLILLWSRATGEMIFLCNPPLSMDDKSVSMWGAFVTSINMLILIVYGYVYFHARDQCKRTSDARNTEKVMRSMTILVLVFCFSWVTCMGSVFLIEYITSNSLLIMLIRSYAVS